MRIFKIWLFLFALPCATVAQKTVIEGEAPELAGMVIRLTVKNNPISSKRIELATDTIDNNGNFKLSCEVQTVKAAKIIVNRFSSVIYLSPGKKYNIEIPKSKWFILLWSWNTGELEYNFKGLEAGDVNTEILSFDQEFFNFFNDFGYLVGTREFRREVRTFEKKMPKFTSDFSLQYVRYSVAEMKLSAGFNRDSLYSDYLAEGNFDLMNPATSIFFFLFYSNYLTRFNLKNKAIVNGDSTELNFQTLDLLLSESLYLDQVENRRRILLKSIELTAFFGDSITRKKSVDILNDFEISTDPKEFGQSVKDIRESIQNPISQNFLDIFPQISSAKINNEKPTFILVSLGRSKDRDKEALVLESLLDEYGDYFQVLELTIGGSQRSKVKWDIIDVLSAEELMRRLLIFNLPWYGWMEPDGSLTRDLKKPSDGLEKRLYSIRAKAREAQKIKVGQ